jgi:exodeoxyribonuclease-5
LLYYAPNETLSPRAVALKERAAKLKSALSTADSKDHVRLTSEITKIITELGRLRKRAGTNLSFALRAPEDCQLYDADLLIVDEISMVERRLGEDLLSFGVPVLVLGDPAQLPPIKDTGFFTSAEPDVMLTEIHRQAEGDPIIRTGECLSQRRDSLPNDAWGRQRCRGQRNFERGVARG